MNNPKLIGILQLHGENDFSLWAPEIPADEPLLTALFSKYSESGVSERGSVRDIRNAASNLLRRYYGEPHYVHTLVYNDPTDDSVGVDIFSTYDAAFKQFLSRLNETRDDHEEEPDWIETLTINYSSGQLHFRDTDGYEVFYLREELQGDVLQEPTCDYCLHRQSFTPTTAGTAGMYVCSKCGRVFCGHCYDERTGYEITADDDRDSLLCPDCLLETSVDSCVTEMLGEYARRLPTAFYSKVIDTVNALIDNSNRSFDDDDIRDAIRSVLVSHYED